MFLVYPLFMPEHRYLEPCSTGDYPHYAHIYIKLTQACYMHVPRPTPI
jgi:hypothetical protein